MPTFKQSWYNTLRVASQWERKRVEYITCTLCTTSKFSQLGLVIFDSSCRLLSRVKDSKPLEILFILRSRHSPKLSNDVSLPPAKETLKLACSLQLPDYSLGALLFIDRTHIWLHHCPAKCLWGLSFACARMALVRGTVFRHRWTLRSLALQQIVHVQVRVDYMSWRRTGFSTSRLVAWSCDTEVGKQSDL